MGEEDKQVSIPGLDFSYGLYGTGGTIPFTAQRPTVEAAFLSRLSPVQTMPRPVLSIREINDVLYLCAIKKTNSYDLNELAPYMRRSTPFPLLFPVLSHF
jgi:hypothetical protein